MGAGSTLGSGDGIERARAERNFRNNPPKVDPSLTDDTGAEFGGDSFGGGESMSGFGGGGFGSDSGGFGGGGGFGSDSGFGGGGGGFGSDSGGFGGGGFGSSSPGSSDPFGGSFGGGSSFGQSSFGGGFGSGGGFGNDQNQQQQPGQKKSFEDIATDGVVVGAKGVGVFLKAGGDSFKHNNAIVWADMGKLMVYIGGAWLGFGLVMSLLSLFFPVAGAFSAVMIGVLTAGTGLVTLSATYERARTLRGQAPVEPPQSQSSFDQGNSFGDNSGFGGGFGGGDSAPFGEASSTPWGDTSDSAEEDEDEEEDWGSSEESDDDSDGWGDAETSSTELEEVNEVVDLDAALASIPDIQRGTQTRQFLFEQFSKVLPKMTNNFSTMSTFDEDSDIFIDWENKIRSLCEDQYNMKEENLPRLIALKENLFLLQLTVTRKSGFKSQQIADDLARIYSFDEDGNQRADNEAFATVTEVGSNVIIKIFTGETAMVSLKDAYALEADWVRDPDVMMPMILGVDQMGKIIKSDFKKVDSVLTSGMPRKGKSWFVKAMLLQMAAYMSPKQLQFYVADPKDTTSDFYKFNLPHIKNFVSSHKDILEMMRYLVDVEAPRRRAIFEKYGQIQLYEFWKAAPEEDMPIIFLVVDEMMTLSSAMPKEMKSTFDGYLDQLVSQLPALGIRFYGIPHRVTNTIIKKSTSDLVTCRSVVGGSAESVKMTLDASERDFPYKLNNVGDMGIVLPDVNSGKATFNHGIVLAKHNDEIKELAEYLRVIWSRLEPEEKGYFDEGGATGVSDGGTAFSGVGAGTPVDDSYGATVRDSHKITPIKSTRVQGFSSSSENVRPEKAEQGYFESPAARGSADQGIDIFAEFNDVDEDTESKYRKIMGLE